MIWLKKIFFFGFIVYSAKCGLYEGDSCTLESTSQKGTCKSINNCPSALQRYKKLGRPSDICGFDNLITIVCCPIRIPGEVSKEYCANYSRSVTVQKHIMYLNKTYPVCRKDLGGSESEGFISGGKTAEPKEFPHMALLGYGDDDDRTWSGGGSLISEYFVLTAAHCLETREHGIVKRVRLGDLNIHNTNDNAMPEEFEIEKILVHPDYNAKKLYNDIALLKLNGPVNFNDYIAPICLQTVDEPDIEEFLATGWGVARYLGSTSSNLLKVYVNKFDNKECNEAYEERIKVQKAIEDGIQKETQICAGSRHGIQDTCQGDSGGPLLVKQNEFTCTSKLIGITSFGTTCGVQNMPGVYTKVSHYITWIEDNVWPL